MPNSVYQNITQQILQLNSAVLEGVKPCGKLSVSQAMEVYSKAYQARMTEALGETFEVVWWCLGDEVYFSVAREYILKYPSTHYNLAEYGEKFPDFIAQHRLSQETPFLPDLARFEWQFKEIFHLPEEKSLDPKLWQSVAEFQNPKIQLTQQMRLLSYNYGIRNIWRSFKNAEDGKAFAEIPDWKNPQQFMLFKKDHEVFMRDLGPEEFIFLTRLNQDMGIELAADGLELKAEGVTELFEFLFSSGLIANIRQ